MRIDNADSIEHRFVPPPPRSPPSHGCSARSTATPRRPAAPAPALLRRARDQHLACSGLPIRPLLALTLFCSMRPAQQPES
ncbi:hypothetical protein Zm00014a_026084 [Zea mays]|uniref:Uncharacterized protein n=1 Tax=Zea mays TaxID=4577 RepID=A0A3L6FD18_MAIZE|nr:hypothetical protein Zm00014a_026084 [Zea mays]